MKTRRNLAIIVAGGSGIRMNAGMPKQYLPIAGKPILALAVDPFEKSPLIDEIILVVSEEYLAYASREIVDKYNLKKVSKIISGGATRRESVLAGLSACPQVSDYVAIHDGVRPFVRTSLIEQLFIAVQQTGAAIPAVNAKDTVKFVEKNFIVSTIPREKAFLAQTPQVFRYINILEFHRKAADQNFEATDDAILAEQYGMKVAIVPGYYDNIKITTPEDLILAEEIMKKW
jgi:2-C-methyl-D-erythritol 4-phosphate cytidylyltransferase